MALSREEAAVESWERTLERVPTLLGRLVYLSSLRNSNTDTYEHFGLAQKIGEEAADRILKRSHIKVFEQWLCLELEGQRGEVEEYFDGLGEDRRKIIATWLALPPYRSWVPQDSRGVERDLFLSDFDRVFEKLRVEYGVSSPDRD